MTLASYSQKSKRKGPGSCYSAAYTCQTQDQKRFTISEVAAKLARANSTAARYAAIHPFKDDVKVF